MPRAPMNDDSETAPHAFGDEATYNLPLPQCCENFVEAVYRSAVEGQLLDEQMDSLPQARRPPRGGGSSRRGSRDLREGGIARGSLQQQQQQPDCSLPEDRVTLRPLSLGGTGNTDEEQPRPPAALEDDEGSQRPRRWARDLGNSVPWPASWNSNVDWQSRAAVSDGRRMSRTLRVSTPRSRRGHRRPQVVSSSAVARERPSNAHRPSESLPHQSTVLPPHHRAASSYVSLPAGSIQQPVNSFGVPSPSIRQPYFHRLTDSLVNGLSWRPKTSDSSSSLAAPLLPDGASRQSFDFGELTDEEDILLYGSDIGGGPNFTQIHATPPDTASSTPQWSLDLHKQSPTLADVPPLEISKPRAEGSSFAQTMFNATNVLAGVGLLAMPYAVATAGALGLVVLLAYSALCAYTGCLLRRCMDAYDGVRSYPDIGWVAFGTTGRAVIGVVLYVELFMVGCEFLILVGDSVAALVPNPGRLPLLGWAASMDAETFWVVAGCIAIMPTMYMRDLSLLSYVSAAGVLSTLAVAVLVLSQAASEGGGDHWGDFQPIRISGLPMATGMYAFCYSGHAMFPSLYISMQDRSQYTPMLVASIVAVTAGYMAVAVVGYGLYGPETGNNVVVDMKLANPTGVYATVASFLTILTPVAKFALTLLPVAEAMEELLPLGLSKRGYAAASGAMRTALVALCATTALSLPFFADVAAIIGSLLSVTISVILPTLCYISISRGSGAGWSELIFPAVCCGVGVYCAAAGTYTSVGQVVKKLQQ